MSRQKRPDGSLTCVTGASRSGKTLWTSQQIAPEPRVLVWDLLGEWGHKYRCKRVDSFAELKRWASPGAPNGRIAFYRPGMAEKAKRGEVSCFETFCRFAWVWLRVAPGALVIEETSSVTSPGKAPGMWGDIVRTGLRYGVDIYALTQRPAESDKTAFGNASVIHSGRLQFPDDRATMAKFLSVPVAQVEALKPLEWIERRADGELFRGVVSTKKRP